jgi:acetoin utilization deacetylase AcuC-like enzyme
MKATLLRLGIPAAFLCCLWSSSLNCRNTEGRTAPGDVAAHPGQAATASAPGTTAPAPAKKTGFLCADIYLDHKVPASFPEKPERLSAILTRLRDRKLLDQLVRIQPRDAEIGQLTAVHSIEYIQRVKAACDRGDRQIDTPDMPISARSYDAAVAAAGGVIAATDAVMEGKVVNAFCAVRPPGHHALKDKAMGFCLFNNVAVAARHLLTSHRLARVLIVDWDVHHGNGTQAAFYEDGNVLYFSVHRGKFYPGTGSESETGRGKGEGFIINVPVPAGATDADYRKAFEEKLLPAAEKFKPDFVLISAGFDAHADDPLGGLKLTAGGYADLTRIVKSVAERHCRGRIVSSLEGGYDLSALADSVEAHLRALME